MKNILLLSIISLFSHFSFGQLEFEQILGTEKYEIISIYESYQGKGDSTFYKIDTTKGNLNIVLGQLYPDSLECEAVQDSLIYRIQCKFNDEYLGENDKYNRCIKLTVQSNCEDCQDGLLDYFIWMTDYCNWLKTEEEKYVSTKSTGWEKMKGTPMKIIYMQVNMKKGEFVLEEKLMDKKEWKAYIKTLKSKPQP